MAEERGTGTDRWSSARAQTARLWWLVTPVLLVLLTVLLVAGCYVWFRASRPDSFSRELLSAALGAVVTVATTAVVALIALRERVRAYLEKKKVRRFSEDSWRTTSIRVGGMRIDDMCVVASCTQGVPWTDRASVEFRPMAARPRDPLVDRTRELWLPELLDGARRDYVLTDGERADLVDAELEVRTLHGKRRPHYTLGVARSSYFDFACSNARLDRPFSLPDEPAPASLRQRWDVYPQSILDVGSLPTAAPIGSGTVVVTADERMILGIRHRTFIAGRREEVARRPVHVVAEGLLPSDLDETGVFSPLKGAYRGVREELHIGAHSDHIARVERMVPTGFCFDQHRWQPYFTFLATIDRTWDEVQTAAPAASDSWESESLVSLPFDIEHAGVRALLRDEHPDLVLASSHAAASLWFALLYQHGFHLLRDELTRPTPQSLRTWTA